MERSACTCVDTRQVDEDSFLKLSFHWRFHEHPHPFQLLKCSREWRKFVRDVQSTGEDRLERIGYGWIYYQLKWMKSNLQNIPCPLKTVASDNWSKLFGKLLDVESGERDEDWRTQILPLLARPEIGLPPEVQCQLLQFVISETDPKKQHRQREWLKDQRRRLVTDAIIAAGDESRRREENPESTTRVDRIVKQLEERHVVAHNENSPWYGTIEHPAGDAP